MAGRGVLDGSRKGIGLGVRLGAAVSDGVIEGVGVAVAVGVCVGVAVGVFFGFLPLVGLKTLLALGVTHLLRGNLLAAAIAVSLHDLLLPVAPLWLRWEYDLGYWLLSHPHDLPPHLRLHNLHPSDWLRWS